MYTKYRESRLPLNFGFLRNIGREILARNILGLGTYFLQARPPKSGDRLSYQSTLVGPTSLRGPHPAQLHAAGRRRPHTILFHIGVELSKAAKCLQQVPSADPSADFGAYAHAYAYYSCSS